MPPIEDGAHESGQRKQTMKRLISSSMTTRNVLRSLLLIGLGYVVGVSSQPSLVLQADIRKTPPRPAFQSGSERSEPIMRDLSSTLKRIEASVARIDKTIAKAVAR